MNTHRTFLLLVTFIVVISFTGCYTQVATSDTSSIPDNLESSEVNNYYSDDDGYIESGYYSETDTDTLDEETTIINNYYEGYPYRSYYVDYYPTITIGFGFGWGWGYWGYYPYYSYWPYYAGWYGWGCYYPYYYSYYPGYYYDPYYYPYYGSGGYYSNYGYKTRSEYVSGIRNNSGGRNYGERTRDPLVSVRDGSSDRSRDDLSRGRDLTVSRTDVRDRTLGIENKTRDLTREVVGLKSVDRNTDIRNSNTLGERNSNTTRDVKQLGLNREVTTKKSLGINQRNNTKNISKRINQNNRIGNETKKIFGKDNSRTNNKQPNVNNRPNNNQAPKKDNTTQSYSPPKQNNNPPRTSSPPRTNNNPPRTSSPPRTNNNPPRSYSPPSGNNNSPRSSSPPSGNRGSNNSGSRNRR